MKLIALVEVHPLSGEPSFITARFKSEVGEFDMPLSTEQAEVILRNSPGEDVSAPSDIVDQFDLEEENIEEEEYPQEFTPS